MSANTLETIGGGFEMNMSKTAKGLLPGCKILTLDGYAPVADLKAGERVITRSGLRVLRKLVVKTQTFRAISVGKGTLAYSRPSSTMKLAPNQEVMLRDWRAEILFGGEAVIIPIQRLIDGTYISEDEELKTHMVYELQFDEQEVFYADGVEVISQLKVTGKNAVDFEVTA